MLTRREFVQAAGAASLTLAAPPNAKVDSTRAREPTFLGGNARYWLGRLFQRNVVEYDQLDELNGTSREQIYEAVAAFGERVLPALRNALFRPGHGRTEAVGVLSRMGPLGEAVLVEAARDVRGSLRAEALAALAHGFPDATELPAILQDALDDEVHEVRLAAAATLCFAGASAKPLLESALCHADPVVRREAVQQVLRIEPDPLSAKPLLLKRLADADLEVRWSATKSLFLIRPVDPNIVPVLHGLIEDGIVAAANHLPLAGHEGLALAIRLLQDARVSVRAAVARALANAAPEVPQANAAALLTACRIAVQDNDLAVSIPAVRLYARLSCMDTVHTMS